MFIIAIVAKVYVQDVICVIDVIEQLGCVRAKFLT